MYYIRNLLGKFWTGSEWSIAGDLEYAATYPTYADALHVCQSIGPHTHAVYAGKVDESAHYRCDQG